MPTPRISYDSPVCPTHVQYAVWVHTIISHAELQTMPMPNAPKTENGRKRRFQTLPIPYLRLIYTQKQLQAQTHSYERVYHLYKKPYMNDTHTIMKIRMGNVICRIRGKPTHEKKDNEE